MIEARPTVQHEDDRALDHAGAIRDEPCAHDVNIESAAVDLDAHALPSNAGC